MRKLLSAALVGIASVCLSTAQVVQIETFRKGKPGLETVRIPAGTFTMGTAEEVSWYLAYDQYQHEVTLTQDYYMCKYPVTNLQFAEFLNDAGIGQDGRHTTAEHGEQRLVKPSAGEHDWGVNYEDGAWVPAVGCEDFPAINVTWFGADEYARWAGGSLPTEAQWERACRGGGDGHFGIGDGSKLYADMACMLGTTPFDIAHGGDIDKYDGANGHTADSPGRPTKVGSYPYANAYGLYDMHGNVWEWCLDWYERAYGLTKAALEAGIVDPTGPGTGEERAMRGGGCQSFGSHCRSAARDYQAPDSAYANIGFRIIFTEE